MKWIIIIVLSLIALNFILLYWRGIKQRDNLRSLLLQILLDIETYKTQKDGLDTLVKDMSVDNAVDLAIRINKSVDNFSDKVGKDTMAATYSLLWGKKNGEISEWIKLSAQEKELAIIEAFKKVANNYCQNDDAITSLVLEYKNNGIFDDAINKIKEEYKNTEPYQTFLYNFFNGYFLGLISHLLENSKNYSIEPKEVIDIINRLSLNDEEFRQIHHLKGSQGKNETVKSHIKDLTNKQKYKNQESNNHIVGLKLMFLEEAEKLGFGRSIAIDLLKEGIPFN